LVNVGDGDKFRAVLQRRFHIAGAHAARANERDLDLIVWGAFDRWSALLSKEREAGSRSRGRAEEVSSCEHSFNVSYQRVSFKLKTFSPAPESTLFGVGFGGAVRAG